MLIANFYFHYAMLTINAFGLQNALERSAVDIGHFFARCHSSAVSCATILRDEMGPSGFLKYSSDSTFVMGSYAVLSLLKVCSICAPPYLRALMRPPLFFPLPLPAAHPARVPGVPGPRAEDDRHRHGRREHVRLGRR